MTHRDLDALRTEVRGEFAQLRGEMRALSSDLRGEMAALGSDVRGEMRDLPGQLRSELVRTIIVSNAALAIGVGGFVLTATQLA